MRCTLARVVSSEQGAERPVHRLHVTYMHPVLKGRGNFSNYLVTVNVMRHHVSSVVRGTEWPVAAEGDYLGRVEVIVVI